MSTVKSNPTESKSHSMSVRTRIGLGFFFVLVLHISIAVIGHYGLLESDVKLNRFDTLNTESLDVTAFRHEFEALHRRLLLFTHTGHESHAARAKDSYAKLANHVRELQGEVQPESDYAKCLSQIASSLGNHELLFEAVVLDRDKRRHILQSELDACISRIENCTRRLSQEPDISSAVRSAVDEIQVATYRFVHEPDSRWVRDAKASFANAHHAIAELPSRAEHSPELASSVVLSEALSEYEREFLQMVQATRGYLHLVNVVMAGETVELDRLVQSYLDLNLREGRALSSAMRDESSRFRNLSTVISAITILLGIVASFVISRQIAPPLNAVTDAFDRLAAGKQCDQVPGLNRGDEIGRLAAAAQVFKDRASDNERLLKNARVANEEAHQARNEIERYSRLIESKNADLARAKERAISASRSKSEFLANMSHEIRTPLTAILGFADLLDTAELAPDSLSTKGAVSTIRRNADHLLVIINDILDLSKIEAGKMSVESSWVSPTESLCSVTQLLKPRADQKGLLLKARLASSIPARIWTDDVRLRQILMNLVGNAIKFTKTGSVEIVVTFDCQSQSIRFDVIDSGIGITEEQLERLFQPFEQADSSTTRKFGGTGLGLRISKRLAELLGGSISVSSTPGSGSVFSVSVATGDVDGSPQIEAGILETARTSENSVPDVQQLSGQVLAGSRILLVEDGPDNQRLISAILQRAGASVDLASNGRIAIEMLSADGTTSGSLVDPIPYDLILSDMQMPEMDGYETARSLREKGLETPILALTANAMRGDDERCMNAGCNGYASKPIKKQKLLTTCRKLIERKLHSMTNDNLLCVGTKSVTAISDNGALSQSERPLKRANESQNDGGE